MNLLNARGAGFELRYLRDGIERRIGQLIRSEFFAPMIRNEDSIGPNRFDDERWEDALAPTRNDLHTLAIVDFELHGRNGVNLYVRLRALLYEKAYAPRLISRKILIDDASARQNQRVLFIGRLCGRVVFDGVKLCTAICVIEAFFKESWRARMIFSRARPEDAVLFFDLFIRDAVVISIAAL